MLPHIDYTEEQLRSLLSFTNIGDLVDAADDMSMDIFKRIQEQKPAYTIEGIDREVILKAMRFQNFTGIPLEKQQAFLALASDRQQFKRAIITDIINNEKNHFGLERPEILLITAFSNMGSLFDQLYIDWRERVLFSDLGRQFAQDPNGVTEFRKKHGLLTTEYVYSVIKEENGSYKEEPLVQAFPVLIKRIAEELQKLNEGLLLHDADMEYINYFNALIDLLLNEEPEKYEFFSKDLDALWLEIQGRIIPIHPMETYQDPGRYIVEPEMSLDILDDRYGNVNMGIIDTKEKMIAYLGQRYKDIAAYSTSLPLIKRAHAAVYVSVMEGARRLSMKPMGINIPNWMEVRQNVGVRIFISMQTAHMRWQAERDILVKAFGEDMVEREYGELAVSGKLDENAGIVAVGGHEIAHNAFITSDVQDRLTPRLYANLEEAKASLTILSGIDQLYSPEEQVITIKQQISFTMMKLQQIHDESLAAYVNFAKAYLNAALESGTIVLNDGIFSLHVDPKTAGKHIAKLKEVCDALVKVYDKGDAEDAQRFMDRYFVPSSALNSLIEKANA